MRKKYQKTKRRLKKSKKRIRHSSSFKEKVLSIVSQIPRGETLTYKEVARKSDRPKAYRSVGNILNKNLNPKIPCHRVVRSDGSIGGYNRGTKKKILKLKEERAVQFFL